MSVCPYCMSQIEANDEAVVCEACGTRHHSECWFENSGCCVRNCSKVSRHIEISVDDDPRTLLVLSRESVEKAVPQHRKKDRNVCIRCGRPLPEGEIYCIECMRPINENQDMKNAGPLLAMVGWVGLLAAAIALIIGLMGSANKNDSDPGSHLASNHTTRTGIHTKQ